MPPRITLLACLALSQIACGPMPLNNRVLIIYNRQSRDSESLAKYYARARHIPPANLCALSLPDPSPRTLPFEAYVAAVRKPVERCLEKIGKEEILYMVLAYVRPLAISLPSKIHEYALDSYLADIWDYYTSKDFDPIPPRPHPYYVNNRAKDNAYAPFVSLAASRSDPDAPIIYSVWRLDGPTPAIARSLVDKAIRSEATHGPVGQACIDERVDPLPEPDEGYRAGDWDLYRAARFLSAAGFKLLEDQRETEFGTLPSPNCPNTALYAGWYKLNHYNDAFTWNDGAIGIHLDSLSAFDPRTGPNWTATALLHGITVTSGAVNEPYLTGLPRPSGVFHDLLAGSNVGDAFLRNTRFLKWMILNVGDPLYTPFPLRGATHSVN